MDSFFVEVERLTEPSLRGIPVAVGGTGPRGVIASASYEARADGVHSAQPTALARKTCPRLRVIPPSHGRYSQVSAQVFAVFRSFTPLVEGLSLDEAFLDVSGLRLHYRSAVEVGEEIRARVRSEIGLPASVGVASVKFLAKLASEAAKPDGLRHIPIEGQIDFLSGLAASALPGVGPATLAGLRRLGVETVGDIVSLPEPTLARAVGQALGRQLRDLATGVDTRRVEPDIEAKSISVEETYDRDLEGFDLVESALLAHAQRLSSRLRRGGLAGRTVTLKVRYPDFETTTRSRTLSTAVDGGRELFRIAGGLLDELGLQGPVRLLGLGASNLEPRDRPRQLGIESSAEWERVEEAVSGVKEKFGESAVNPARLLEDRG
jgi:nucleotidyltransferase/DNA polymerase involved in DNA repair